ncbi:TIGR03013 family XrtA/PEP-CTERM system glycosyltransferase [Trichlorobacter ammonificans]|uniref:Glycosyl transferase n=1 Tax=Trichlorobacter ammonificans TaxID=2916410 RepID=A0ABN8HEY4_9BACT|nr:TIGR03013 family XrtA/PEP-CTERM system glycosyltransferase [Trichlorobacter ammonificans]CAH2031364.1 Glycosyl transferase [Trichlorobacter ammonificans]
MELHKRILLLVTGDILAAMLAILAALAIHRSAVPTVADFMGVGLYRIALFVAILVFLSFLAEIYANHHQLVTSEIAFKIVFSLGVACLVFSFLSHAYPDDPHGNNLLVSAVIAFGILQFLCHVAYRLYVKCRGFARRVLILGVGPLAGRMGAIIPASDENYVLSGYVQCANEATHVPPSIIIENTGSLYETVKRQQADKIVVSLSERRGVFPIRDVMACKLDGVEVIDAPTFYEQVTGKLFLEGMNPSWIIFSDGFKVGCLRKVLKRGMDICCAVTGILLTAPFFPLIALAIRLDSPGPVFYRQERVGEKEKPFWLYKFRTMRSDAESATGAVWAQQNDSRVTRVGAFFRKSRIDELPQFFNILRGDMSMVGPRPERPEFVNKLKESIPYYSERHFVKPGVTGWAQVRYPYGASVEDALEKLRYDLYYIKNLTLSLDLMIILETIRVVLFRKGAR